MPEQINIKVDESIKRRMVAAAKKEGLGVSGWLRRLALVEMDAKGIETPSKEDAITHTGKNMNTDADEITAKLLELREQGFSAKVIAVELNKFGYLSATMKPFNKGSVEGIIRRLP